MPTVFQVRVTWQTLNKGHERKGIPVAMGKGEEAETTARLCGHCL